jgi:RNAse (barnase) inhibitor barstar
MISQEALDKLKSLHEPYFHIIVQDEAEVKQTIHDIDKAIGYPIHTIDSNLCTKSPNFFKEISISLKLPDYFGKNWDALDECLADMEWLQEQGWVLFFLNSEQLLCEEKKDDFDTLIDVLHTVGKDWSTSRDGDGLPHTKIPKPFHFIFHTTASYANDLIEKFGSTPKDLINI